MKKGRQYVHLKRMESFGFVAIIERIQEMKKFKNRTNNSAESI